MCKVICRVILNAHNSLWCILNMHVCLFFNILICMIIYAAFWMCMLDFGVLWMHMAVFQYEVVFIITVIFVSVMFSLATCIIWLDDNKSTYLFNCVVSASWNCKDGNPHIQHVQCLGLGHVITQTPARTPTLATPDCHARLCCWKCCFTFTETVGLLGVGAQDGHLDFHSTLELWHALHGPVFSQDKLLA